MSALPSDEVAGDYRDALDDLITNDRFQIANLTMIAKENIEHAEAISRTLTLHIKKVRDNRAADRLPLTLCKAPPSRKLPALYVLDSLVKNIGSPYTVYFGRNLHETYMLAYSQVDQAVRRKLEEMLKTWREPVPGSLSSTPVFPLQSTQSIMDALNRYKASTAGRAPQQPIRAPSIVQAQAVNYRQPSTPTPPQPGMPYPPQVHVQNPTPTPPPQQYYQVCNLNPSSSTYLTWSSNLPRALHHNTLCLCPRHTHQFSSSHRCSLHIKHRMATIDPESTSPSYTPISMILQRMPRLTARHILWTSQS